MSEAKITPKQICSDNLPAERFWAAIDELLGGDGQGPHTFVVYYAGHGCEGSGAWGLANSECVTPNQLGLKWSGMI